MKLLMIAALIFTTGSAFAATPTEAYLAVKDKAVAALKHPAGTEPPPDSDTIETNAVLELASLIRKVIGPIGIPGFSPQGKSNIVSLADGEIESGYVDGIRVTSPGGVSLLVTTLPLVQSWLKITNIATDAGTALTSGSFYTQAVASDAAVNIYASIPIAAKSGASTARAFLIRKAQDFQPLPPNGLIVSVIHADKVFIFDKPYTTDFPAITACKTAWAAENKKAQALYAAFNKGQGIFAAFMQAEDKAADAFMRCYGEQAIKLPFYRELVHQAQELADRAG